MNPAGVAICSRCPSKLDDQVLNDQAVTILAPMLTRFEGERRRDRGYSFAVLRAVFAVLPGCYGLCFWCALEVPK